jgi:hypothetical protein
MMYQSEEYLYIDKDYFLPHPFPYVIDQSLYHCKEHISMMKLWRNVTGTKVLTKIILGGGVGVKPSALLLWAFVGLLYQPWLRDGDGDDCG